MARLNTSAARQRGLTLVGVVIAVMIFVFALFAITQLMGRTSQTIGISREEFVATNLAREGLELVQAARDTNWFSNQPWTGDSAGGFVLCDSPADRRFTIEADDIGLHINPNGSPQLYQNVSSQSGNHFTHRLSPRPEDRTPYSREIQIDCRDYQSDPEVITVTSRVTWTSRGENHAIEIKSKLFNWYAPL